MTPVRLVGGVSRTIDRDQQAEGVVATIAVNRSLKSGALDVVGLTEATLARVVAEGAAVLSSLAAARDREASS